MLTMLNTHKCKYAASLLLLQFIFIITLHAQKNNEYVYIDSTLIETDTTQYENNNSAVADTFLIKNSLQIKQNWLTIVRSEKELAYATTLQPTLQQLQKEAAEKQQSTGNNIEWLVKIFTSKITQAIFWTLGAFLLFFLVFKLYNAGGFFAGNSKKLTFSHHVNDINTNMDSADVNQLLAAAKQDKNYRLAIRYLFLQSLQKLAAKNIITLHADKTNQFYLQQLLGKPYALDFSELMYMYDYIWYGAYSIEEERFLVFEKKFHQFNKKIFAA
jgi:hypothetical protein